MKVRLDDGAELFCTIDDFTDPWTQPETVVLHHGMAKNHKFWYAWVPGLHRRHERMPLHRSLRPFGFRSAVSERSAAGSA
jgi:hypothetical protein